MSLASPEASANHGKGTQLKTEKTLSPSELQALAYWRLHMGWRWKAELMKAWGSHDYGWLPSDHPALLHGLRNRLGPTWLARFSLDRAIKNGHSGESEGD